MRVLFIGLGSIGTRHLRNLTAVAAQRGIVLEAEALRSSDRALPPETAALLARQYAPGEEPAGEFDVLFVTNPTQLHYDTIARWAPRARALFLEKPLFVDTCRPLSGCGLDGKPAYVACPMRHSLTFRRLKEMLAGAGRVYSTRLLCSSYLPEWRPGADYRKVYSARKELGGGVSLDLIHEWDYLIDLFGLPEEVRNFQGRYSDLELNSEDLSVYIARYPSMLAEIHLDYFGRTYRRTAEFFTAGGTITADFGARTVTGADGAVVDCAEDTNQWYIHEMNYFLDYIGGKAENINPPALALAAMEVALGGKGEEK